MIGVQRNELVDIGKGIAIILMCIGHASCPEKLCEFIYLFHMPFFFIMSGYFFSMKNVEHPGTFVWRRVKGLYIPFVKWAMVFILLHNVFLKFGYLTVTAHPYTLKDMLWKGLTINTRFIPTEEMMGPYWFLSCLFFVSIYVLAIFWITYKLQLGEKLRFILFILLYFVGMGVLWWIPDFYYRIPLTLKVGFIFYIGYLLKKNQLLVNVRFIGAISFIVLAGGLFMGLGYSDMGDNSLTYYLLYVVYSVAGCFLLLSISYYINLNKSLSGVFIYIGQKTLVILMANILCLRIFKHLLFYFTDGSVEPLDLMTNGNNPHMWLPCTIFMVVMPLAVDYGYNRLKAAVFLKNKIV